MDTKQEVILFNHNTDIGTRPHQEDRIAGGVGKTGDLPWYQANSDFFKVNSEGASPGMQRVLEQALLGLDIKVHNDSGLAKCGEDQGACITVAVSIDDKVYVAFLGDTRYILQSNNDVTYSSAGAEHKATSEAEIARVKDASGLIFRGRLGGLLAVTGATGDHSLNEFALRHNPDFVAVEDIDFIILETDGISDVMEDKDVIELVKKFKSLPKEVVKQIIEKALANSAKDNLSAMVWKLIKGLLGIGAIIDGHGGAKVAEFVRVHIVPMVFASLFRELRIYQQATDKTPYTLEQCVDFYRDILLIISQNAHENLNKSLDTFIEELSVAKIMAYTNGVYANARTVDAKTEERLSDYAKTHALLEKPKEARLLTEEVLVKEASSPKDESLLKEVPSPKEASPLKEEPLLKDESSIVTSLTSTATRMFMQALQILGKETYYINNSEKQAALATLRDTLYKAHDAFYYNRSRTETEYNIALDKLKEQCNTAIAKAKPALEKHRGWHKLQSCEKMILGVFAILTIIPAVIVALVADSGIKGTFFATQRPKTKSEASLLAFKVEVSKIR